MMARHLADPKEYEHLSHKERMDQGYPYLPSDPEICKNRLKCRKLLRRYNNSADDDHLTEERKAILRDLFNPNSGENIYIEPDFKCEYGYNITIGRDSFLNFTCVIMDCGLVTIGKSFMCGPHVQIVTASHPLDPDERNTGYEHAKKVTIGDDCWFGTGAIICPGVTIGNGVTVGAGSVVTKDVPDYCVVAGNPARIIRHLEKPEEKKRGDS